MGRPGVVSTARRRRERLRHLRFWANVVITALHDATGTLRGFAKVTGDLTNRRTAEEELRRSEQRLRLLIDSIRDYAVFMLDAEGRVATWNAAAERIIGYRADEIVGTHFSAFYPDDEATTGKCDRELDVATAKCATIPRSPTSRSSPSRPTATRA